MDKNIFKYALDGKTRHADPLAAWNRLTIELGGDPYSVCENAAKGENKSDVEIAQATDKICTAVINAFRLPSFDENTGKGATLADALRIWGELIAFNDACKKKRGS